MKISEQMATLVNKQINEEFHAAYLYFSMSLQMTEDGYQGFAHWFRKQYEEEMEHAMDMIHYLQERGHRPVISAIKEMPTNFGEPLQLFEEAYKHECQVTEWINNIYGEAMKCGDYATASFMKKYVDEQVEEEDNVLTIIEQIKMAGVHGLFFVNAKLAKR